MDESRLIYTYNFENDNKKRVTMVTSVEIEINSTVLS